MTPLTHPQPFGMEKIEGQVSLRAFFAKSWVSLRGFCAEAISIFYAALTVINLCALCVLGGKFRRDNDGLR